MHNQPGLGLPGDSDFFDWKTGQPPRFFLAAEVLTSDGYRIEGPASAAPQGYEGELPRSAS